MVINVCLSDCFLETNLLNECRVTSKTEEGRLSGTSNRRVGRRFMETGLGREGVQRRKPRMVLEEVRSDLQSGDVTSAVGYTRPKVMEKDKSASH